MGDARHAGGGGGGNRDFDAVLKGLFSKLPTQWLSYIIALVILLAATAATGGIGADWTVWAIVPLNAVIVSLSANGGWSAVKRVAEGKAKEK